MLKTSYNCEVADQRSPAEYHIISNSPHIGDTRTKSISKGISTVSVSKRGQITSKVRDIRRPIFSPNAHLMSSDSIRQMVPVVHVQLSSGTKRTENSAERNIPQGNNYNLQQKRPSEPINMCLENTQQQQIHYNNILSIMKDQLNKSISNLQKRADEEIKKNQQAVKYLEKKLRDTEELLGLKLLQISKLKQSASTRPSLTKKKQDIEVSDSTAYFEYISGKLRDIDIKISILVKQHAVLKNQDNKIQSITKNLQEKIEALGAEFIKIQLNKLNTLSTRVTKFVESRDKLLQNLIVTTQQITKKQKQPIQNISQNFQKYQQKIMELKNNQEEISKTLQRFGSKEFKYDHFQVDNLKCQLKRLNSVTSKIQSQQIILKQKQFQSVPVIQKPITSLQSFNQMAKKPEVQTKQYLMNSKLSFTGQTCSFQDYHPPNDGSQDQRDHFFYPQQDSSYQRFTDEQQSMVQQQVSQAVVQLTDTIRKRKMKMPVKCSINQGYVKLVDAGAYILDMKGSLMEFTAQDIETAVGKKFILL